MKKITCCLILLLSLISSIAKSQFLNTGGDIDKQVINFGFLLGVDNNYFRVTPMANATQPGSNPYAPNDTLSSVRSKGSPGISMGIVTNFRLSDNVDIRFLPTFSFADRALIYTYNKQSDEVAIDKVVEGSLVEFPVLFKFKSDRKDDFRLYVVAGLKYTVDIRSESKKEDDSLYGPSDDRTLVKVHDSYMSYDVGIGADIYLTYFKFTPEIRLSRSFGSTLGNKGENKFTQPLDGLFSDAFHLTFYFE